MILFKFVSLSLSSLTTTNLFNSIICEFVFKLTLNDLDAFQTVKNKKIHKNFSKKKCFFFSKSKNRFASEHERVECTFKASIEQFFLLLNCRFSLILMVH